MKQSSIEESKPSPKISTSFIIIQVVALLLVTFIFMLSLELMASAFNLLGRNIIEEIIKATSNPFISLFIGLLSTAIVQSSSTTTSMIVAIVASGALTLESAVPMIMGANIGTTITSTIVSLGHIIDKKAFRKAFAVAILHDFFNILVTLILFPLEYYFGLLSSLSRVVTSQVFGIASGPSTLVKLTVKPLADIVTSLTNQNGLILLILSVFLLFFTIRYLTNLLKKLVIGESQKRMDKYVFGSPTGSLLWGAGLTAAIHSSSTTTSFIVQLVAADKLSIKKAFPFIMGANVGTTITALIASISKSEAALSIALAHVLFNVIGVFIFFPIPVIRQIPVYLARYLGSLTMKNRLVGLIYIILTFFLIPFILIYLSNDNSANSSQKPPIEKVK
ncbi:Na/Pi symporter [Rhodocytophaga aerolata]|uniref:Na/Pi symporter n=1 Tax=Rhodocytophaga aerolata TaxID=455078 RepID=A0ABT8RJS3_9BACT|nr:Na/Pi symporter [Rhodocytophaga aerolata]